MSDEWVETTLGAIADIVGGGTPSTKEPTYWNGDVVWLTPTEVVKADGGSIGKSERCITQSGMDRSSAKLLPAKTVLLTSRASVGFAALASVPLTTNQGFQSLIAKPSVLPEFLLLWIQGNREEFRRRASGSTFPEISKGKVATISIRSPPLAVQRRIVDLMTHLDNHLANLRAERDAVASLEGPLIEALLGSDGQGFEVRPMGELGQFLRGRRFTKAQYVSSGLGCIHYGQVHTHFGHVATECLTFLPESERTRLRLARSGDVVVAATSEDLDGLGKATVWQGRDDVAVHDDCYIYRHTLDPIFASFLFASPTFQYQKRQFAGGTKVTRISGADLAKIEVAVPSMQEQVSIGKTLIAVTEQSTRLDAELKMAEQSRSALLNNLLLRKVDVPDTYDERVGLAS